MDIAANHRNVAERELINHLLRALGRNPPTTHRSRFFSALHNVLMYIIGIIVATFFFVQAMETVSFIVSPNAGIFWKLLWVLFLSVIGVFTACMGTVLARAIARDAPVVVLVVRE
jgi:hypothetical protein